MQYSITREGDFLIAAIGEPYPGSRTIAAVLAEVSRQIPRPACVLLEFCRVRHLEAAAVALVLDWLSHPRGANGRVGICVEQRSLLALLELVRAHRLVEIFDDPVQARMALRRAPTPPASPAASADQKLQAAASL